MAVIYIVLPLAIVFAGFAVWACIWAIRTGQFEDTQTPAMRVLLDDAPGKAKVEVDAGGGRAARRSSSKSVNLSDSAEAV